MEQLLIHVPASLLFALLGFILLFVGYRVFDLLTPTPLNTRIFEEGNLAAAVLAGAFVVGLAIVVAAAIS